MKTCTRCRRPNDSKWKNCERCRKRDTGYREKHRKKAMPLHSQHCECGRGRVQMRGRGGGLAACAQCIAQDGNGMQQFELVQVLRSAEGTMSTEAIAFELGLSHNSAAVLLSKMVRRGLIGKRTVEYHGGPTENGWGAHTEFYVKGGTL